MAEEMSDTEVTLSSLTSHTYRDEDKGCRCTYQDGGVVALWVVSLFLFLAGVYQRMSLPMRNKPKADPLFYSGIIAIAIMTPVLMRYFVVRVSRAGASRRLANPLGPDDDQEWVSLMPGDLFVFKARRESPETRLWATRALRLGAVTLFVTPCCEIGLAAHTCLADGRYAQFAAPAPIIVLSCFAALWFLSLVLTKGSRALSPRFGKSYLDLHLACVAVAAIALAVCIALGFTLGPAKARQVAKTYDEDDETDEYVFHTASYIRCGLLFLVALTFAVGARLRRAAGKPCPKTTIEAVELGRGETPMKVTP